MPDAADGEDRGDATAGTADASEATASDATADTADASDASAAHSESGHGAADADRSSALEGAVLAGEVASLVTATVAFVLSLGSGTTIAVPGGSVSALEATFWLLALAAAFAAAKARRQRAGLRSLGHGVVVVGLVVLAAAGSAPVAVLGGTILTAGTIGVIVAVAGLNLVVLSRLR